MPNPNNARRYQQWQECDRCGFMYPMSELIVQKGLLICTEKCFDNLTVEQRPWMIMQVLGPTPEVEGADLRVIDRGFFGDFDQIQR